MTRTQTNRTKIAAANHVNKRTHTHFTVRERAEKNNDDIEKVNQNVNEMKYVKKTQTIQIYK